MTNPIPPTTEPPTFEELLNQLRPHQYQCDCSFCAQFFNVKAALTDFVSRLLNKLQSIEDVAEGYVNTDDGDHANWVSIMGGMILETRKCMDEARENTPTPEEAKALYDHSPRADRITHAFTDAAAFKSGWAKLLAISASEEPK